MSCIKKKKLIYAGRMAFDQFYTFGSPYESVLNNLETVVENKGEDIEYIILEPYANIVVYQFASEVWDKYKTRGVYEKLVKLADSNIEKNGQFKAQFEASKARMKVKFEEIKNHIFDCEYFINEIKSDYGEDITDPEQL